jgi:hypothetical protein
MVAYLIYKCMHSKEQTDFIENYINFIQTGVRQFRKQSVVL